MAKISDNFLVELYKLCLTSEPFLGVVSKNLKYQYIPSEVHKTVWQEISDSYELDGVSPTIGVLSERLKNDSDAKKLLIEIKNCKIGDNRDSIIKQFESYIRDVRFVDLYTRVGEMWNKNTQKDRDDAIAVLAKESEEIVGFSIGGELSAKVFSDFEKRQELRKQKEEDSQLKIPFGIHALDHYTYGGGRLGTSGLILGRSGAGKSTFLRWVGLHAARLGYRVVHFQAEGTESEAMDNYDAAWTSVNTIDIEYGNIPANKATSIRRVREDILKGGGEIYVVASETFDSMYIEDCNERLEEIENKIGKVHLVLFDYLEIFNIKGRYDGEKGERLKRDKIANKITNIATKFNVFSLSATQANDIKPEKWNSPDYVMTRSDISEFKGALKPFSYFMTLNQTKDESDNGVIRLHNDKFRHSKSGQTYKIYQSLDNSRFYDSKRTLQFFWDAATGKPI